MLATAGEAWRSPTDTEGSWPQSSITIKSGARSAADRAAAARHLLPLRPPLSAELTRHRAIIDKAADGIRGKHCNILKRRSDPIAALVPARDVGISALLTDVRRGCGRAPGEIDW